VQNSGTTSEPLHLGYAAYEIYDALTHTPTDVYKGILDQSHLEAAARDPNGEIVALKPDGTPYDHVTEVVNAQNGLINRIDSFNAQLSYPNLGDLQRYYLQNELGQASRLLDYAEQYVPRK
jgi:hypothetical protein